MLHENRSCYNSFNLIEKDELFSNMWLKSSKQNNWVVFLHPKWINETAHLVALLEYVTVGVSKRICILIYCTKEVFLHIEVFVDDINEMSNVIHQFP